MRLRITITGTVQGVGFRPFVFRLASELGLTGYVLNDTAGVLIEAQGGRQALEHLMTRLPQEMPPMARIYSMQHACLEDTMFDSFEIRQSSDKGRKQAAILPDIALCTDCMQEIIEPKNRRFLYPFTNCTNCGPRFTIITSLPYDRPNTSMKSFAMCSRCKREYDMPSDRRFHAQPNACPECGPWISLYDNAGNHLAESDKALEQTVNSIRRGLIVALKGIGGYHLMCDALNEASVAELRKRKGREQRPLAVMFPDMEQIRMRTIISGPEERAVTSVERPIVIVRKREGSDLARSVAPGNSTVGVFLPYTPLHQLILRKLNRPVIATSANLTDEPIVSREKEAFARLSDIADIIVTHNREIIRKCDDSVVRIVSGLQVPVRRSRGFAPLPVIVPFFFERPVLSLGPYMNSSIAIGTGNRVYISQHIGDLDSAPADDFYEETIMDLLGLFDISPEIVVADLHPGYYSTKFGERKFPDRLVRVQHHFAHIISCMAENDMPDDSEVIGVAFDGTGYGTDRTIWGSEVMTASYTGFQRRYHLMPFMLPGGDSAVMDPRRTALSLLYEACGKDLADMDILPFSAVERAFFLNMLQRGVNSPLTSGMGRLFDGVAALTGICQNASYHAQAAIELEQAALRSMDNDLYPYDLANKLIDHRPLVRAIVRDLKRGVHADTVARRFHNTIAGIIISTAHAIREETGLKHVALSGGVFQNALLLEQTIDLLSKDGFIPLIHQTVPANDGGISLGQAVWGIMSSKRKQPSS